MEEGRPLTEIPTWAVATVISLMVASVFLFTRSVEFFAQWLDKRKRKPLTAALDKIKEELIVFGVLSLLLGHWSIFVAKICIKSSMFSTRFYPCIPDSTETQTLVVIQHPIISNYSKDVLLKHQDHANSHAPHRHCAEGYESFASYESLEQLHRLLFVLGVTHVTYSSLAIAFAVLKIYSWRTWEDEAKSMALQTSSEDHPKLKRLCTFVVHHASHPWSQHKVFVWLVTRTWMLVSGMGRTIHDLRQFWSSINKFDYIALRFGFITTHQLPLSYDFLNYMIRSMDEEVRDIVGISLPLWIYAIFCIFLDFHGSNVYFWLSFVPAIIIIIIGTKLHRIVVKLAVEIMDSQSYVKTQEFKVKLRDELFWFGKPRLLLRFIQFISFQNAFEMAMFLWSLWEIDGTSCFMNNPSYIAIRLTFGIISQVWCSYITFPLYVIITQMGSRFKRTVISEGIRKSLHGWKRRVKAKQNNNSNNARLSSATSMPLIRDVERDGLSNNSMSTSSRRTSWRHEGSRRRLSLVEYGDVGVLFTSRRTSLVDGERIGYDSDTSSDYYYEEEEEEEDNKRDGVHYFHLP